MFISSMTGFARKNGSYSAGKITYNWVWEIKSVNGKTLDVKTKLPSWIDKISFSLKNKTGEVLNRGTINAALDISTEKEAQEIRINDALMNQLATKAIELYESNQGKLQKPTATDILNMKGVLEVEDVQLDEEATAQLEEELLKTYAEACEALKEDRLAEGQKMKQVLLAILDKTEQDVAKAEEIAATQPEVLKEKLREQINALLEPGEAVSDERLAQEIVIFVNRIDIREEIDRLKAHIKTARDMLQGGGAVGRRLDFLCQELNREANTMCSKSNDINLTNIGMELKALIEQFREQVQNIE